MDFNTNLQQEFRTMFDESGYEDDVFYSELRKQVLQLTAEDDDERKISSNMVAARKQGTHNKPSNFPKDGGYYNWPANKEDQAAPPWILNLWRNSGNGTGVFIPQIIQSRRKNRSRRYRNERGRSYKCIEKMNQADRS